MPLPTWLATLQCLAMVWVKKYSYAHPISRFLVLDGVLGTGVLLRQCWNTDPSERPRFKAIVRGLKEMKAGELYAGTVWHRLEARSCLSHSRCAKQGNTSSCLQAQCRNRINRVRLMKSTIFRLFLCVSTFLNTTFSLCAATFLLCHDFSCVLLLFSLLLLWYDISCVLRLLLIVLFCVCVAIFRVCCVDFLSVKIIRVCASIFSMLPFSSSRPCEVLILGSQLLSALSTKPYSVLATAWAISFILTCVMRAFVGLVLNVVVCVALTVERRGSTSLGASSSS